MKAIPLLLFPIALGSAFAEERLNALLITADDLGIQLSCYGDPIANTPRIDKGANSYEYLSSFDSWVKTQIATNARMAKWY